MLKTVSELVVQTTRLQDMTGMSRSEFSVAKWQSCVGLAARSELLTELFTAFDND